MLKEFKVRIHCNTYNHSEYIADAMNGFVMQKTDFPFVAVIFDDASTDGEQEVILSYLWKNFKTENDLHYYERDEEYAKIFFAQHKENENCFFAVYLSKYNHYSIRKDKNIYFEEWQSEYIAFCEGDDYWIDSRKLQMQVDILDTCSDVGLVYSRAKVYYQKSRRFKGRTGRPCSGIEDLIYHNAINTLTVLCRKKYLEEFYKIRNKNWKMGDYPLWLFIAGSSQLSFIDEDWAVYRFLEHSASHSPDFEQMMLFQDSVHEIQLFFSEYFHIGQVNKIHENDMKMRLAYSFVYGEVELLKDYYQKILHPSFLERLKFFVGTHPLLFTLYRVFIKRV